MGACFSRTIAGIGVALFVALVCFGLLSGVQPTSAGAFAAPGVQPTAGTPGLPDGRIYEQVSPSNKYGNAAGGSNFGAFPFMTVTADGNGVFYSTSGPVGESGTGFTLWAVAKRSPGVWSSSAAMPRPVGGQGLFNFTFARAIGVSANLERTVFTSNAPYVGDQGEMDPLFLAGASGRAAWSGEPLLLARPLVDGAETWNQTGSVGTLAGASADLSTVYFVWGGTLVQGDDTPDPKVEGATRSSKQGMGFYQWKEGALTYAGKLPDGTVDPYGAENPVPNGCMNGDGTRNQVSTDGSRAFFISPVPGSGAPASDPTQLYVHKIAPGGGESAALVSRDTLLNPVEGQPVGAPHGPIAVVYPSEPGSRCGETPSYVYGSPDGSHVFFESVDRLTALAPADETIKQYEFDVDTETLTYLPGVTVGTEQGTSPILASTADGSGFVFEQDSGDPGEGVELDMWTDGADGPSDGHVTQIAGLPGGNPELGPARIAAEGSVVVFQSNAALAGFNNGGLNQVYRYDSGANTLICVSCPPTGVTPSGPAYLTHDFASPGGHEDFRNLEFNRGVTSDGSYVYFDTPEALVPQDVNGKRDVYEWHDGANFLISSGSSHEDSFFGDNSPSGGDVVFSTAQGLVPGDDDEGYDVYDARIPRPGDDPPPGALPCQGDVCQGPPSVPVLLGVPASASFEGLGNPHAQATTKAQVHKKTKRKAARHAKRKRHPRRSKHKARKSTPKKKGDR